MILQDEQRAKVIADLQKFCDEMGLTLEEIMVVSPVAAVVLDNTFQSVSSLCALMGMTPTKDRLMYLTHAAMAISLKGSADVALIEKMGSKRPAYAATTAAAARLTPMAIAGRVLRDGGGERGSG